jgi:hypothetical protein
MCIHFLGTPGRCVCVCVCGGGGGVVPYALIFDPNIFILAVFQLKMQKEKLHLKELHKYNTIKY